jgi:hypothetical protein
MTTTAAPSLRDRREELETRAAKLAQEIQSFVDRIDAGETLTPEQSERFERQAAPVNRLQGQIEEVRAMQLDEIRHFASIPSHVQSGDGARQDGPTFQAMHRGGDPWDGEVRFAAPTELRDRACARVNTTSTSTRT